MFIAIEGIDGSGKSTLASSIEKSLSSHNYRVYRTYEPTDKFTVNKDILDQAGRDEPLLLLSLFLKDRIEHSNEIRRQLDMGNIVICDRYSLSRKLPLKSQGRFYNPYETFVSTYFRV